MHLKSPLYGADIKRSFFKLPPTAKSWNLNALGSFLSDVFGRCARPGINVPYIYVGGFRTMFAWHVEDFNFASINYLHCGSPKLWYTISPEHQKKFERWVKLHHPQGFVQCSQFLRHKTTLVNPYLLKAEIPDLLINK